MKITIQVAIETAEHTLTQDLISFERKMLSAETLGLSLEEAKNLTAVLQGKLIEQQIKEYAIQQRPCPRCSKNRLLKGYHPLVYRTLFGKFRIQSPRLWECRCQVQKQTSFSPLSKVLPERSAPELTYLP